MKEVIHAAAGLTGFGIESARDLVLYMVRRGQMRPEEAEKLLREVEDAQAKRKPGSSPAPAAPPPPMPRVPEPRYEPPRPSEPMVSRATLTPSRTAGKVATPVKAAAPARHAPAKPPAKSAKPSKPAAKAPAKSSKPAAKKAASKKR
jgi:hypothetical protein